MDVSINHAILSPTFQRVEQLSCGDIEDVDDPIDGSTSQILSIWTLRSKNPLKLIKPNSTMLHTRYDALL